MAALLRNGWPVSIGIGGRFASDYPIRALSGLSFTLHDLRRTYITIAESLDIPHYALKNLVNHKISHYGDVTAGYIISNPERLRKPMQKITDYILKQAKQEDTRKVISMQRG